MFIFVLQTIWLYISELAGKDLDVWIILKFLWYFSPKMMPLVLPLTILFTSLMVFGSFSENYEFAAMKSTGISLQRDRKSTRLNSSHVRISYAVFCLKKKKKKTKKNTSKQILIIICKK